MTIYDKEPCQCTKSKVPGTLHMHAGRHRQHHSNRAVHLAKLSQDHKENAGLMMWDCQGWGIEEQKEEYRPAGQAQGLVQLLGR